MQKTKRSKLIQVRVTEDEHSLLLQKKGPLTLSEYIRISSLGKGAPKIRSRNTLPIKDHKEMALLLALLRQTHYASNFNQVSKAINCGMVIVPDYLAESTAQACEHIEKIHKQVMLVFGKKV